MYRLLQDRAGYLHTEWFLCPENPCVPPVHLMHLRFLTYAVFSHICIPVHTVGLIFNQSVNQSMNQ